ncbi:MAG: response regulator [Nitrospirae bacterium YQR-1]
MKDEPVLKSLTVLYAEDEGYIRELVTRFLKRRVAAVHEAGNGREGLDIFRLNKAVIDVVITDIQMPVMDGMTMIEEILKIEETQPIIITTAFNDEYHTSDKVCKNVIKPINLDRLLESIMFCIGIGVQN